MAHRLTYWEDKSITIEESKKYSSRTEFCKMSYGAYRVSKKNNWLDEMTWLDRKNVYKDPVDCVYRYYFVDKNCIYVGRTIYPELRDKQHRTKENDTVYKFSKENEIEIPKIEILENNLTVIEGAKREKYWAEYYKENGFTLINKQPCGSLGYMSRGKWSKEKCFEEARKYKTRSEFQRNASHAFATAMKRGWINEMDWLPKNDSKPSGYWKNKENFLEEAKKYSSRKEMEKANLGAYAAGLKYGYFDDVTWMEKRVKHKFGYWKDKELVFEESKKYSSKNEFKRENPSAYWASYRYGYLKEMTWLEKNKVTPRGLLTNKEYVLEESKKYISKSEFARKNRSVYEAAIRYGYIDEMYWLERIKPEGYWDDKDNVIKAALMYDSLQKLKTYIGDAYKSAKEHGWLDDINHLYNT